AARNLIGEIANSFIDNDGNYAQEFQSINFNARLWELYLHVYLHNAGLRIIKANPSPDFEVEWFGEKFFIEAVTVNPSQSDTRPDLPSPETEAEVTDRLRDFMPIKFGSALYSKLQKRYWELPHVTGRPLILAIHDYHVEDAMVWSRTALAEYLFGLRTRLIDGAPVDEPIGSHQWQEKVIPSGFFNQPESEWVSAVLFSNQATIPKFNRMGRLAGLGSSGVKMIRRGYLYNPDPTALDPIPFARDLDDPDYEESWSDGLVMYHNPNAKHPLPIDWLRDISHVTYTPGKGFLGYMQPYDVLASITLTISPGGSDSTER